MARILVVDDAEDICTLLERALAHDGHLVTTRTSAADVTLQLCREAELIVLDVMMPGEDGLSLCRRIRGAVDCPILFLTARDAEEDAVDGFDLGADDYITKPFRLSELRARVAAHLRRQRRAPVSRLADGPFCFDLAGKALYIGEQKQPLTPAEYGICEELARHPGLVYTRERLLEAVLGCESESDTAAITEHIKNIRYKLAASGASPIETVWGVGYKWNRQEPLD